MCMLRVNLLQPPLIAAESEKSANENKKLCNSVSCLKSVTRKEKRIAFSIKLVNWSTLN